MVEVGGMVVDGEDQEAGEAMVGGEVEEVSQ